MKKIVKCFGIGFGGLLILGIIGLILETDEQRIERELRSEQRANSREERNNEIEELIVEYDYDYEEDKYEYEVVEYDYEEYVEEIKVEEYVEHKEDYEERIEEENTGGFWSRVFGENSESDNLVEENYEEEIVIEEEAEDTLKKQIIELLPNSFNDRIKNVSYDDDFLNITLNLRETIRNSGIRTLALSDASTISQTLVENELLTGKKFLQIAFETVLVNQYGERFDTVGISGNWEIERLERVQWDNFSSRNIENIAYIWHVHPTFRD